MELGVTLEAVHCFEIGVHAAASMMYPIGIEWLQLAALQVQNGDPSVQLAAILPLLEKAKLKVNDTTCVRTLQLCITIFFYSMKSNGSQGIIKTLKRHFTSGG